jgi:hypothetical protein
MKRAPTAFSNTALPPSHRRQGNDNLRTGAQVARQSQKQKIDWTLEWLAALSGCPPKLSKSALRIVPSRSYGVLSVSRAFTQATA